MSKVEDAQKKALETYDKITKEISTEKIRVLDGDDPVANAIIVERKVLGKGGECFVYKGKIDISRLTKEGLKQIYIPILTHQKLNGKHSLAEWGEKNEQAKAEVNKNFKTKESLEIAVKEAFKEQGIIKGDRADIAVRVSSLPTVNLRDERAEYVLGMRGDNIVYHIAHGEVANTPYGIIELMDGILKPSETVSKSPSYHLHVLKSIIRGLKRFNELGIVHRDIKPDNIFFRGNHGKPEIKIADFGAYKADCLQFNYTTKTGVCIGTPVFMSPEQPADAKHLTHHSDQFSTGATMYTLLADENPLGLSQEQMDNLDLYLILCHVVNQTHKRKSFVDKKDIQLEGIERVLARMMQKTPTDRYQNYDEILEDIKLVEKKKLPKNSGASLISTVFEQGKYSNHYNNLYRSIKAGLIGIGVAGAAAAASYYFNIFDSFMKLIKV